MARNLAYYSEVKLIVEGTSHAELATLLTLHFFLLPSAAGSYCLIIVCPMMQSWRQVSSLLRGSGLDAYILLINTL